MHRAAWIKLFIASAILTGNAALSRPAQADIISNGVVQLGINQEGHLNVPYPDDPLGIGSMGIRYIPTGNPATEPGCLCEGWGVGDAITGVAGWANVDSDNGANNLTLLDFMATANSAISTVQAGSTFVVTHDYHPSPATPNLFEVVVTIQNISGNDVDVRYRRVMDWDIYPTPYQEYVTIDPGNAEELFRTDTNGFNSANPFTFSNALPGPVVDAGPADLGALFDFDFGALSPGQSKSFKIFYGGAGSEDDALTSLSLVAAEAYSFGQPSSEGGAAAGTPNTFIFAFAGIHGSPIFCGNGTVEPGEQCDDGALVDGDGCDSNCTVTACGNGIVTVGEQCDDGNLVDDDGCEATCTFTCPDADGDDVCDDEDNCGDVYNPGQGDADGDGLGNACDPACLTLQRGGLGDVFDAYVSAGEPNNAGTGAYTSLYTGNHSTGNKKTLIAFDLIPITEGATILSAEMQVFLIWHNQPGTANAHVITAPWSEVNVTYNTFNNAFDPAIIDSVVLPVSTFGFQSWDVTDVVQAWVDRTLDSHGVLLEESGPSKHTYRSSEHGTASDRPKLNVCYIAP